MNHFLIVTKSDIRTYQNKRGGAWQSFHCRCAILKDDEPQRGLYTVFFPKHLHSQIRQGDCILVNAKKKGRYSFSVLASSSWKITGRKDVGELVEKEIERLEYNVSDEQEESSDKIVLNVEYISRPKKRHGMYSVVSKLGDKWLSIPVSIAAEYFGHKELWSFSWPNNGFGTLTANGYESDGAIVITEIVKWEPDKRTISETVPLSEVNFGNGYISFETAGRVPIALHGDRCPLPSKPILNDVKKSFSGDLVLKLNGTQVRHGGYRSGQGVWSEWVMTPGATFEASIDDSTAEKLEAFVFQAEKQKMINAGIEMLKALVEQEQADLDRLLEEYQKFVPDATREDVIKQFWSAEYDQQYFDILAAISDKVYPYADGFVILAGNSAVIERPVAGTATYVFDRPTFDGGVQELLTIFNSFNLLQLRQGLNEDETKADVAGKVGLRGVAIHREYETWRKKIVRIMFYDCHERHEPLIEGDLAAFATLIGLPFKS